MAKTNDKPRMMPHNLEAEQSVLGCILINEEASVNIISQLSLVDFYSEAHKYIFEGMQAIYSKNINIDFVTLNDELEKRGMLQSVGGISYITELTNIVPSASNYQEYVDIVKRDSVLRKLITASEKIIKNSYESSDMKKAIGFAEQSVYEIAEHGQASDLSNIQNTLTGVIEKLEAIHRDSDSLRGLTSGFYQIDEITNGFQKADLILIAARPGVGKTALAMNFVTNAALKTNAKCAIFSLEMPRIQLAQRMLCSVAGVDMTSALKGKLTADDWTKIWKANKQLSETQVYIDDSSLNTPASILSKCRKIKREKGGLDLVMIDYLQLMSSDNKKTDNRQTEVSEISRRLKVLAKEMDVPVLLLSQLSRAVENRTSHIPVLSDLRESGAIEQDADIVMFIHKPEMYNTEKPETGSSNEEYTAEIIFAKHRNGRLGKAFLGWKGSNITFVNLDRDANTISIMQSTPSKMKGAKKIIDESPVEILNANTDAEVFDD